MRVFGRILAQTTFAASFISSKVIIFGVPLMIAKFTTADVYGSLEFALAVGLFFASLLAGPVFNGLNHIYLTGRREPIGGHVAILQLLLYLLCLVAFGGGTLFRFPDLWLMVIALFPLAISQNALSTLTRAYGQRNRTAWTDGTATFMLGIGILAAMSFGARGDHLPLILLFLAGAISMGTVFGARGITWRASLPVLRSAFAVGLPMTIFATFPIWLSTSGRILVGLVSASDVASYSIAFRIAGFSLGVHQLASTAMFRRLYIARTKEADRMYSFIMAALGLTAFLLVALSPLVVRFADFAALSPTDHDTFFGMIGSMGVFFFMWSGFGWLQLRLNRTGLARKAILPMFAVSAFIGLIAVAFHEFFSQHIVLFCWLLAAQSVLYFAVAWTALARAGLPHRKSGLVGMIGVIVLAMTGLATAALA